MRDARTASWLACGLAILLAATTTATAQSRRTPTRLIEFIPGAEFAGSLGVDDDIDPSLLVWREFRRPTVSLRLPFDVPGDAVHAGGGRFVVSGIRAATGEARLVLVRLQHEPRALALIAEASYGTAFDPCRLYLNRAEARLYVHDFAGERILVAPFDGGHLPPAELFECAATAATLPDLRHLSYLLDLW